MSEKAGYVTIIGRPNAGKSTLLNAILKEKLSIVTYKPQTTRKRILGILTEENYQIIFYDTPGILEPEYLLQKKMMEYVKFSVNDADILILIIDIDDEPEGEKSLNDEQIIQFVERFDGPKILVINKIDLADNDKIKILDSKIAEKNLFDKVVPLAAKLNFNINSLLSAIIEKLPEHPLYFPEDQLTDENERFYVTEIIREKILELYREEIPYSVEVVIDEFKERGSGKDFISASIIVEKESQKPIIIGKSGEAIKKLGLVSRKYIEELLQREVFLELRVKVKEGWRADANQLRRFGYEIKDE